MMKPSQEIHIEAILPHRGRMKLIDSVIDVNETSAVTSSRVSRDWPTAEGDSVSSIVIIELVAQTAGVIFGWDQLQKDDPDAGRKGWLVGIKFAEFFTDRIPVNDEIIINAEKVNMQGGYAEAQGDAMVNSEVVGRFNIQLFRPESET